MVEKEQIRPLAPTADRPSSGKVEETALHNKGRGRKKCIICCGCIAALLLIPAIVIIILIFTIFRVRDPVIRMNSVTVDKIDLVNGTTIPKPGTNMSITADVSVKNENFASFKFRNTTTSLYYHGDVIGEARGPPGYARARRTMQMNVSVDISVDRLISNPYLQNDTSSGMLPMTSFTRVGGRVKFLNLIKKHVIVKINCSMTINVTTQSIQEQKCKRKVKL